VTSEPFIRIPEYYDRPQKAATICRLTKGAHEAVFAFWTHPIGGEVPWTSTAS
jgi:hypothetical protein